MPLLLATEKDYNGFGCLIGKVQDFLKAYQEVAKYLEKLI